MIKQLWSLSPGKCEVMEYQIAIKAHESFIQILFVEELINNAI